VSAANGRASWLILISCGKTLIGNPFGGNPFGGDDDIIELRPVFELQVMMVQQGAGIAMVQKVTPLLGLASVTGIRVPATACMAISVANLNEEESERLSAEVDACESMMARALVAQRTGLDLSGAMPGLRGK
jgi:hypothetical protein